MQSLGSEKMRKIGKYAIIHKLGSGSQGVTFKVLNTETKKVFAMKCIQRGHSNNQNVEREIENHGSLQHPNVIQFEEVVRDNNILGIVMEYAERGDLSEAQLDGVFCEAEARKMFQELIAGVSYIHSKGICHRDLKLTNVLLTSSGLKICDFGLSKLSSDDSFFKTKVGTPAYQAPEIESHQQYSGQLADVWSCGVLLYNMLNGEDPNLESQDIADRCDNSSHVSEDCKNLIRRMLVEDPNQRITIEKVKKHPWYLKDLPQDLTDEDQEFYRKNQNVNHTDQSKEQVSKIIEEAKKRPENYLNEEDTITSSPICEEDAITLSPICEEDAITSSPICDVLQNEEDAITSSPICEEDTITSSPICDVLQNEEDATTSSPICDSLQPICDFLQFVKQRITNCFQNNH